jgi:hypothetical protein
VSERPDFSVVYYSDGRAPAALRRLCLRLLVREVKASGGEMVLVTWHSVTARGCVHVPWPFHEAGYCNLYGQILAGIEQTSARTILLAEHDVLYPPGYHSAMAKSAAHRLCYNTNVWRLNGRGYFQTPRLRRLLSNCAGPRNILERAIRGKLAEAQRRGTPRWAEPGSALETFTPLPTVDIRHGRNFTGDREAEDGIYVKTIEHWANYTRYLPLFVPR